MLQPGVQLGAYRILAPIGAGGMGEVYRARDTRLGRDVAIKVLPAQHAATPEIRARFEREARTISQLNHPHICVLHDVGRERDTDYLVMELVEGETLAQRLLRGPLPTADVLRLGTQIADALDRAHRAGVIHRDLKPGNVMLTKSGVKLMDFGLARGTAPIAEAGAQADSPTMSRPLTAEGTIVGTFQYMAPEQLEGKEADARTDIWALGCVLYEMATGARAFEGKSQASLIAAILEHEPRAMLELQPLTPPALEHAVKRCLAKDPDLRWQSARDVMHELEWVSAAGSQPGSLVAGATRPRRLKWLTVGLATVTVAAAVGWVALNARHPEPGAVRAIIDPPPGVELGTYRVNVEISPDGQSVVFAASDTAGTSRLWIRPLKSTTAQQIPGPSSAWLPFWSPDSRYIAYFDSHGGILKKVPVTGGSPIAICAAPSARGGTWNRDGVILFALTSGPLMRVSSMGGEPVAVTALDSARHETGHRFPRFLPDGRHFLFATYPGPADGRNICVGALGSREVKRILSAGSTPTYADPGYLLFEQDRQIMAQRFDAGRLELEGEAVEIAEAPMASGMLGDPTVSASRNGILAMLRSQPPNTRLVLLDRTGSTRVRYQLHPAPWVVSAVSRDGKRAALTNGGDLWILDLSRPIPLRLTRGGTTAAWSPEGDRLAFITSHSGREEICVATLDGRSQVIRSTDDPFKYVTDWSGDGRFIVFVTQGGPTRQDLWLLPLGGDRTPVPYLRTQAAEYWGRLSPDGRWLAYSSDESGQYEIYVQSFPQPGRKVRVSLDGGREDIWWTRAGRELIYSRGSTARTLMSVPVAVGKDFLPGTPRPLFTLPAGVTGIDVVGDGEGFLVTTPAESRPRDIQLIVNWRALLK